MQVNFAPLFLILMFTLAAGCSDDESPISSTENTGNQLRIVIKWPGDDFASNQDLAIRDKIEQIISEKGLGKIVRSGTGMGWMDLVVEVTNKDSARIEIERIVKELSPNSEFTIQ